MSFILLVLLLSSTGQAFSPPTFSQELTGDSIGQPVVQESEVYVYESTPVSSLSLQKTHLPVPTAIHLHHFCSHYESVLAHSYLKRSVSIVPGLDIPDIIFPFHIFL